MAATHLQKITARAKQIRKAHPKMIWTDAIKKASKELAGKKVGAVKKKAAPKKAAKKKAHTKWGKVASHKRRVAGSEKHTDTKSHNVNIRVVSGMENKPIKDKNLIHYYWLCGRIEGLIGVIEQIKKERPMTPAKRAEIKFYQKQLIAVKKQKAIQKQLI